MELSVESSCQYVKWKVQDFFDLPSEIGYSLDSLEFRFAGDSYCLRLYPNGEEDAGWTEIKLVRLTSTFPERSVSCKLGHRYKDRKREAYRYISTLCNKVFLQRSIFQKNRDEKFPDGTFTVLCSMRLKEPSRAAVLQSEEAKTSDTKEEQEGLPGQCVFFSSRSWSFKMELSVESACQNVMWKVPDFFRLLSKIGYSLNSPDFHFGGDRYCLRFYPKGNNTGAAVDTDLQLVRLTSTFPERIVLYKVGYIWRKKRGYESDDLYTYSGTLIDEFGFCLSRSQLEEKKDTFVQDGTLTVLCAVCLKQTGAGSPHSEEAGNSYAEEKQERLSGNVIAHHFDKAQVPDSVTCAIQSEDASSMSDKENQKDENLTALDTKGVALLGDCMKELLIKGIEHDVTICVQNKEFQAHRIILSARSPVFAMMFAHDTKESNTSTINIEDCDPESFDKFLLHVYSGRTENLTPSNALQLYYTADKYNFPILKEQCVNMLKASLSVSSICDVVLLAAKHQEKELLEVATEFFAQNLKEILVSVGWQNFMSQNPVEANELYIRSMEILLPENEGCAWNKNVYQY